MELNNDVLSLEELDNVSKVFSVLAENTIYSEGGDEGVDARYEIGDAYDYVKDIGLLERAARRIASSTEPAYEVAKNENGRIRLKRKKIAQDLEVLRSCQDKESFDRALGSKEVGPYTQCLIDVVAEAKKDLGTIDWIFEKPGAPIGDGRIAAEYANDLLEQIRQEFKKPAFRRQVRAWAARASDNYRGAVQLIQNLFRKYSKLLIIRVDLGYHIEHREHCIPDMTRKQFKRLLNNRRGNKLFENLVGIVWRLETGEKKGFHYHVMLIFDGSLSWHDINISDAIGKYWRDRCTEGKGTYWPCNRYEYKSRGIGLIEHSDQEKYLNLLDALSYLTKVDEFLQIRMPKCVKKFRTFSRSVIRPLADTKKGRRRFKPSAFDVEQVRAKNDRKPNA